MLRQRILTALVLLAVLLPTLWVRSPWPFTLLALLFIAAAGWEWARLNGLNAAPALASGLVLALLGAALGGWGLATQDWPAVWWAAGLAWLVLGAAALRAGVAGWTRWAPGLRLLLGWLALWVTWLAVARARALGVNFLLSLLSLVWMADIAAYFVGRAWGTRWVRRRLAPSISPGKSWEGVFGGWVGTWVLAALWLVLDRQGWTDGPSLFTRLAMQSGWLGLGAAVWVLAVMSVVGDLFESLVKRSAACKDSSQLLPGHGGVLDRIDALLPTLPLALMLITL